jgi:hypothetical protein
MNGLDRAHERRGTLMGDLILRLWRAALDDYWSRHREFRSKG